MIHFILPHFLKCEKGARIRRGELHNLVFKALHLRKNNANVYILKSILASHGIEEILIDGKRYYAGPPTVIRNPRKTHQSRSQKDPFSRLSKFAA